MEFKNVADSFCSFCHWRSNSSIAVKYFFNYFRISFKSPRESRDTFPSRWSPATSTFIPAELPIAAESARSPSSHPRAAVHDDNEDKMIFIAHSGQCDIVLPFPTVRRPLPILSVSESTHCFTMWYDHHSSVFFIFPIDVKIFHSKGNLSEGF